MAFPQVRWKTRHGGSPKRCSPTRRKMREKVCFDRRRLVSKVLSVVQVFMSVAVCECLEVLIN